MKKKVVPVALCLKGSEYIKRRYYVVSFFTPCIRLSYWNSDYLKECSQEGLIELFEKYPEVTEKVQVVISIQYNKLKRFRLCRIPDRLMRNPLVRNEKIDFVDLEKVGEIELDPSLILSLMDISHYTPRALEILKIKNPIVYEKYIRKAWFQWRGPEKLETWSDEVD